MSMNTDLQLVLRFLGPEGAKQGLVHSTLTSPELLDLLGDGQSSLSSKPSREEVAHEIAYKNIDLLEFQQKHLVRCLLNDFSSTFTRLSLREPK